MSQEPPTTSEMLRMLIAAGGTLPQSTFNTDWNDAGDWLFWHGLIDCDHETVTITANGRSALA